MKLFNIFPIASPTLLVLLLSACGGGIGSNSGNTGGVTANAEGQILAKPNGYASPLADLNYQNIRALIGTGIGATLSPSDLRTHYSFPSTLTGLGQTIAIVDAPGSVYGSAIATDLNTFSAYYKLPLSNTANPYFKQIDLSSGAKVVANSTLDWKYEVALDTQWAHAMAPAANIILVTAKSTALSDMIAAVKTAAAQPGVVAISMSWGGLEFSSENSASYDGVLQAIQAQGIILLASSGDSGNNGSNQQWPAASPYVTSVGGTSIKTVGYTPPSVTTEVAWTYGGGGVSIYETMPSFQKTALNGTTVLTLDPTKRAIPDISYNADPSYSPVAIVTSGTWYAEGGTSAGAPQWAAITALISQYRTTKNESTLQSLVKATTGGFNGFIYQAKVDTTGFFDVTSGSDNTTTKVCAICNDGKGYSAVTGWGVPNVSNLLSSF